MEVQFKALTPLTVSTSLLATAFAFAASSVFAETLEIKVSNPDGSAVDTMVIFAEPIGFNPPDKVSEKVEIAQEEWAFNPFMTVVQLQDEVAFTNKDDFTHHIYSISGNNRFSFKLKPKGSNSITPELTDNTVAQIVMGCNIHDWMSGYILVVDTPYFGKTDQSGVTQFQLEQDGSYKVTLWHPQLEAEDHLLSRTVDVQKGVTLEWKLPTALKVQLPEVNEDEFDFLEKY
jgi:plastocyanin